MAIPLEQETRMHLRNALSSPVLLAGGRGTAAGMQPNSLERTAGAGPHLFLDDYLIAEQHQLTREVVAPGRLPQPIVNGPEDRCFQPYVTVIRNSVSQTGKEWKGTRSVTLQSESEDLLHWSTAHRIVAPDAQDEGETQFYCMGGVLALGGTADRNGVRAA